MGRKKRRTRRPYDKCQNPNHFNAKPELAATYWKLYQQGLSTADIGKVRGVARSSIYNLLKSHGYKLREKKQLQFVMFNGGKYTIKPSNYYAKTDGSRSLLHRDIWEYHNGQIPDGWDVHHINEDKQDNRLENLECIDKAEHTRHHIAKRETKAVKRIDTGEIYPSANEAARIVGRSRTAITQSIHNRTKSAGTYWEYV